MIRVLSYGSCDLELLGDTSMVSFLVALGKRNQAGERAGKNAELLQKFERAGFESRICTFTTKIRAWVSSFGVRLRGSRHLWRLCFGRRGSEM